MGNKIILDWIGFNSVVEKRDATVFSPRACRDHPRRKRVKNTEVLMAAEEPEPARAKSEEGFLAVDGSCAESIFGGRTGTMTPEPKEYQR